MPKFRKKPVVIEAEKWEGPGQKIIPTLEGDMAANPGDWIITGVKGEKYPCKPDVFEATYERVQSTPSAPPRRPWCQMCGQHMVPAVGYPGSWECRMCGAFAGCRI